MKLRKPGTRASVARSTAQQEVGEADADLAVESVEAVDNVAQVDRFEVGSQGSGAPEEEEEGDEEQQLFADALEDPTLAKEVTLPLMIGSDALSTNVEASLKGILALVDSEEDNR